MENGYMVVTVITQKNTGLKTLSKKRKEKRGEVCKNGSQMSNLQAEV